MLVPAAFLPLASRDGSIIEFEPFYIGRGSGGLALLSQAMDFPRFKLPPGPSYVLRQLFGSKVASCVTLVGSLRTHPSDKFMLAFSRAQEHTFPRGFYGKLWPLVDFWEDAVATHKEVTWEFINPLIRAALDKKKAEKGRATSIEMTVRCSITLFSKQTVRKVYLATP